MFLHSFMTSIVFALLHKTAYNIQFFTVYVITPFVDVKENISINISCRLNFLFEIECCCCL